MKKMRMCKAVLLSVMLFLLVTACGNKEGENSKEYVYIPEYRTLDLEGGNFINAVAYGDNLYVISNVYDEQTNQMLTYLFNMNLLEGSQEKNLLMLEEDVYINQIAVNPEGNLLLVAYQNIYEQNEAGEVTDYSTKNMLLTVSSKDASIMENRDISSIMQAYEYVQSCQVDGKGNFYLYADNGMLDVYTPDLKQLAKIDLGGSWINQMATARDGIVYVSIWGGESGASICPVDLDKKAMGEPLPAVDGWGNMSISGGQISNLLISGNDRLSGINAETNAIEPLFSWLDVDVDGNNIRNMGELSDGRIWELSQNWNGEKTGCELVLFTRKKASEVEQKREIVLGTAYLDYRLKEMIIDFNKSNTKYRITVKEYGQNEDGTQNEDGQAQFIAAISSGKGPDIIDLSALNVAQYASRGVLEDLYPYMEQSGFKKEDYLENILGAYELDGRLYGIMGQFSITTVMAKASKTGDITGWTLSEFLDFAEKNEVENLFQYQTRSSILAYCVYNNIDDFIDWENGQCSFDTPDFIRVLEFAAQFPEEYNYNETEREGTAAQLHADKILLMQNGITSMQEFQMYRGLFGEPIACVGFPNKEKEGNLIVPWAGSLGISSRSQNKEGAWEFVSMFLSDEYQNSLVNERGGGISGFPVSKAALEKQFTLDSTPDYYEDEKGNQVEQAKTSWGYDDFNVDIYAATEEEVDAMWTLIESAHKVYGGVDQQLSDIIMEEAAPFFAGQKTASDVAGVIQNRIRTYVNESR